MTIRPFVFGLSLLLVGAIGVSAGLALSTPAQAQTQPSVGASRELMEGMFFAGKAEAWMNQQLKAGRHSFATAGQVFCAW